MSTVTGSTIPTNLSSDIYMRESASAFRFTLWVSFFVLLFSLISMSISRMCFNACATSIALNDDNLSYEPIKFRQRCGISKEDFENSQYEQGTEFKFNSNTASKYKTIQLNSPESNDSPHSLMVGQVDRYFKIDNGKINIIINILANLYILDGNIFGELKEDQEYRVYAYTIDNTKLDLGKLVKSPDNFYKLKITSDDPNLLQYNRIEVVYKTSKTEDVILVGGFESI